MIPLSVPHLDGNEWKYVKECLDTGWVSTAGAYVNRFEAAVAEYTGAKHAVACMNGTSGLHLSLQLLGVQQGDYVILPNLTFVASANAIHYTGAEPLLIDVSPNTWQMDLGLLEEFLGMNTLVNDQDELILKRDGRRIRAIMPVHVLGNMMDMGQLQIIAQRFHLKVLEDATESLGSRFQNQHSGTFAPLGVFSFNGNKIITTGGGGMIITDEEDLARRARHLSTTAKVSPEEYIHDEVGYNYRLVNVLAAIGLAQMEQLPAFVQKKKEMDAYYRSQLAGVGDIRFQDITAGVDPNCWLFTFRTEKMRELLPYLNANGVQSRPFWMPMNQLPMFRNNLYIRREDYTGQLYDTCISIPSSIGLNGQQLESVCQHIRQFYGRI